MKLLVPPFKNMNPASQLAYFIMSLFGKINHASSKSQKELTNKQKTNTDKNV